jgi:hypothetical protein
MSLESKIYTVLSGSTALTAVVGSRIYPEHRQQADALPAVVYNRAGGLRVNSLSGYSGLENAMIEVTVYAASIDTRREVGDLVTSSLTAANVFKCIQTDSPSDFYDDMSETYERSINFSVWNQDT